MVIRVLASGEASTENVRRVTCDNVNINVIMMILIWVFSQSLLRTVVVRNYFPGYQLTCKGCW